MRSRTGPCIPKEFVCDREKDCPNGEDEALCLKLKGSKVQKYVKKHEYLIHNFLIFLSFSHNYALVMELEYGVWHTKCFHQNSPMDFKALTSVCSKRGYTCSANWQTLGVTFFPTHALYRKPLTKVQVHDNLANGIGLYIRYNKPTKALWNTDDIRNCDAIEVHCNCS